MKKFILNIGLVLALATSVFAAPLSRTIVLQSGGFSNLLTYFRGSAIVTDVIVSGSTTNAASVYLVDTRTNSLTYTTAAYSNVVSYATNYIDRYTNFFGVVNSFTNVALIDTTNVVAAATNNFNIPFQGIAPTNSSLLYAGQQYYFANGVWATNLSSGSATVTITYQQ